MNDYLQTDGHALIEAKRVVSELRPPATIVLHIHRCIGREQQLHHLCAAIVCCPVQWGVTSAQRQHTAREGFEQSHSQSHCEPVFLSRNFIKPHLHYMNPCELDDGWPESEKHVFQAALSMVVVKNSR